MSILNHPPSSTLFQSLRLRALLVSLALIALVPLAFIYFALPNFFHFDLAALPDLSHWTKPDARSQVQAAWARARTSGAYHFTADIVQTTIPLTNISNLGRTSKQQSFHLEGSTNLPQQSLQLAMWSNGGSVADPNIATQIKVEGDKAYTRRGAEDWQPTNDFTGVFAPSGDFLAYLSAAKNIVNQGKESRAGVDHTRYTFELDGLGFATFVRDQLQTQMMQAGKLPYGVNLDLPAQYRNMTGEGELWVGANGLPLRQIIRAKFPPQTDYRLEAEFTVNFSDYANLAQSSNTLFGLVQISNWNWDALAPSPTLAQHALVIALMLGAASIFIRHYRTKRVYTALASFVIAAMVLSPLLQTQQALAFSDGQKQQAVVQKKQTDEQNQVQDTVDQLKNASKNFEPHVSPLTTAAQKDALEKGPAPSPLPNANSTPSLPPSG